MCTQQEEKKEIMRVFCKKEKRLTVILGGGSGSVEFDGRRIGPHLQTVTSGGSMTINNTEVAHSLRFPFVFVEIQVLAGFSKQISKTTCFIKNEVKSKKK